MSDSSFNVSLKNTLVQQVYEETKAIRGYGNTVNSINGTCTSILLLFDLHEKVIQFLMMEFFQTVNKYEFSLFNNNLFLQMMKPIEIFL